MGDTEERERKGFTWRYVVCRAEAEAQIHHDHVRWKHDPFFKKIAFYEEKLKHFLFLNIYMAKFYQTFSYMFPSLVF